MTGPGARGDPLLGRLAEAGEAVEDAGAALLFVRPSRAKQAATRSLRTARSALRDAHRLAGSHDLGPDANGDEHIARRRDIGALLAALAATPSASLPTLEGLAELVRRAGHGGTLDPGQIAAMRELTCVYAEAYTAADPATLTRLVAAHLNELTRRLDEPITPGLRRVLGAATAEVAALAGWLAALTDRRGDARAAYYLARDTAREALDDTQHALALGSLALLSSSLRRDGAGSPAAARLLEQADLLVPASAPPTARAWLAGQLAEQQAALGQEDAAQRALEDMDEAFAEPRDDGVPVASAPYTERAVLTFWGECGPGPDQARGIGASCTGDPGAVEALQGAADRATEPLGSATLLVDLGQAQLRRGEVEAAASAFARATSLAGRHGYTSRLEWLRGLRRQIRDDRLPAVRELDEALAAV